MELMDIITMTPTPVVLLFMFFWGRKMDKKIEKKSDKVYSDEKDELLQKDITKLEEDMKEKFKIVNTRFDSVEQKSEHQYEQILTKLDKMTTDNNTGHRVLSEKISHIEGSLGIPRKD